MNSAPGAGLKKKKKERNVDAYVVSTKRASQTHPLYFHIDFLTF